MGDPLSLRILVGNEVDLVARWVDDTQDVSGLRYDDRMTRRRARIGMDSVVAHSVEGAPFGRSFLAARSIGPLFWLAACLICFVIDVHTRVLVIHLYWLLVVFVRCDLR